MEYRNNNSKRDDYRLEHCFSDRLLVVSNQTIHEAAKSINPSHVRWAFEILQHWSTAVESYEQHGTSAFDGQGKKLAAELFGHSFGYLSAGDKVLLADALESESDVFLATDQKLVRTAPHLERRFPIKVLEPTVLWETLIPWAGLF